MQGRGALFYKRARALACDSWGITPVEFDRMCKAQELTATQVVDAINAKMLMAPNRFVMAEFIYPGITERIVAIKDAEAAQNRTRSAFESILHNTKKADT